MDRSLSNDSKPGSDSQQSNAEQKSLIFPNNGLYQIPILNRHLQNTKLRKVVFQKWLSPFTNRSVESTDWLNLHHDWKSILRNAIRQHSIEITNISRPLVPIWKIKHIENIKPVLSLWKLTERSQKDIQNWSMLLREKFWLEVQKKQDLSDCSPHFIKIVIKRGHPQQ